ncbi:hypothetical protein GGR58DRAFT_458274 [Xylaria digitata]|nr:hypothetical protein GGR58DRAFT_458274 [Xylaria digitata]
MTRLLITIGGAWHGARSLRCVDTEGELRGQIGARCMYCREQGRCLNSHRVFYLLHYHFQVGLSLLTTVSGEAACGETRGVGIGKRSSPRFYNNFINRLKGLYNGPQET